MQKILGGDSHSTHYLSVHVFQRETETEGNMQGIDEGISGKSQKIWPCPFPLKRAQPLSFCPGFLSGCKLKRRSALRCACFSVLLLHRRHGLGPAAGALSAQQRPAGCGFPCKAIAESWLPAWMASMPRLPEC